MIPEMIPSIYNGEKTVIYGLLMEKSEQKGESMKCKATLTGDIVGKKFNFDIPFELTKGESEEDASVIHQLAVKKMIQEWQEDEEPFEQRHKKDIIALSTDASVVSMYTAYIAVDVAQNKPVSGSMQSYELIASGFDYLSLSGGRGGGGGFQPPSGPYSNSISFGATLRSSIPPGAPGAPPPPPPAGTYQSLSYSHASPPPPATGSAFQLPLYSRAPPPPLIPARGGMPLLLSSDVKNESLQMPSQPAMQMLGRSPKSATPISVTNSSPVKQTGVNFIVSLQQANGSWLLNDQLAGVVSESVEELKSCCPVSCDDTVMANVWATLVVIELLKKKYPSMLEELELVIMKAGQWLSKQALPSGVNLAMLKENTSKLF